MHGFYRISKPCFAQHARQQAADIIAGFFHAGDWNGDQAHPKAGWPAKVQKMDFVVDYKPPAEQKRLAADEYEKASAIAVKVGLRSK